MKKLFAIVSLMVLSMGVFAYDFSAVCPSGDMLYYNILSETEKTVEVTYAEYFNGGYYQWYTYYYGVTAPYNDIIIPEHVQFNGFDYTVIAVGDHAFDNCVITTVNFPNTIISIGMEAFYNYDMMGEGLLELVLPENLQTIGYQAFGWNTNITSLSIPNSVTSIGQWCFYCCIGLKHLSLGSGLEDISYEAFSNCRSLDSIIIHTGTPPICQYSSFRGVDKSIPVFVPSGTKEQYEQSEFWNEFTNYFETDEIANGTEWYYEIQNDDGSITYQHLECAGDTAVGNQRPKIIVRSNTQYDKDEISEVTHEYVYAENDTVYWWNKELEEFTTLYDLNAEAGDEWEIKVGMESITVHVDSVGVFEYEGEALRVLHISDAGNIFNGDIVVGYGHMTSFFPERLMNRNANYIVNGLRCYWVGDALIYHNGEEDCDAVYSELHHVVENNENNLNVYPNPANNVLIIETQGIASLQPTYRIINVMGQTLQQGIITDETQRIDIANLKSGMYFISVGGQTVKFVVK